MNEERARRVEAERAFHNKRFSHEVRDAQQKYYFCISDGADLFERRIGELSQRADVLEYGCGATPEGLGMANTAKSVTGIDISDVAVAEANERASQLGLTNTSYLRMDAEEMAFGDRSLDLVFGRGIIHHLNLERCFSEVFRVLRPGGRAVFWEPLGHNPVLNGYRSSTPEARTPDEHPLLRSDFELAEKFFQIKELRFFGLTSIIAVPMRGSMGGKALLAVTSKLDQLIFRSPLRWLAWYCMIDLEKPQSS